MNPAGRHIKSAAAGSAAIAWLLAAAILLGGLPAFTGVTLTGDSRPAFTLDICHPAGAAALGGAQIEAPLIPARAAAWAPVCCGAAPEFVVRFTLQLNQAPDPPPPKLLRS